MKRTDDTATAVVVGLPAIAAALALLATACDNPLRTDNAGESTPAEDDAVIATYTQTVNQTSSSQDTTIAPNVRVDGNNNNVIINVGDGNEPDAVNQRNQPAAEAEPVPGA